MTRLVVAVAIVLFGTVSAGSVATARAPVTGVTVTASPRWGRSTPGAWTPYLLSVKNDSLRDIEGQVVLMPVRTPPPGQANETATASSTAPETDAQVPNVLALGETELTVPRAPGSVRNPGDFPSYRAPMSLAAGGGQKSLTVLVVEAPYGYRAELRDNGGAVLGGSVHESQPRDGTGRSTVALLSQAPGAAASLGGLGDFFAPERGVLTLISSARDFPGTALLLSGLDCIVVDRFDTTGLSAAQLGALQDYVAFGGSLVLAGGPEGARAASALPDALLPFRPTGTMIASLSPLADLAGRTTDATTTITTGEMRRGRSVLQAPGGPPLVVEAEYGAGRVVQLAYDPLGEALTADSLLRDLAWYQAMSRGLAHLGAESVAGIAPPEQLWSRVLAPNGWPRWPGSSLWLLAAYPALVLPLGYGLLRWRRRTELAWVLVPLVVLVLAGSAVLADAKRSIDEAPTVEVRTLGPSGEILVNSYRGIGAMAGKTHGSDAPAGAMASTTFAVPAPLSGLVADDAVHGGRGGGVIDLGASSPKVAFQASRADSRNLQVMFLERQVGLESHLRLTGTEPPEMGGLRVTGTVMNRSPNTVLQLRAQLPGGALARLADTIRPGQTLQVDAPFVWPRSIPAGSGIPAEPADRVMFAAASNAFSSGGQVVVAGLFAEAKERISVMVQPVPLDSSEQFVVRSRARVVASIPEPAGTRLSVHDIEGLPGVGSVELRYGMNSPPAEIYDWTAGTWRLAPPKDSLERSDSVALSAGEVHDGVLRIRAKGDPKLFDYSV